MGPEMSRPLRRVTFVLLALAACAVEVAAADTRPVARSLGAAAGWVAAAAALARFVPLPADPQRKPPRWVYLLVFALAGAPFVIEPARRALAGEGSPLELQMVAALRNVGLGLAACAGWLVCLRAACVASLFLMLFSAAMSNHPAVLVALGLYTAAGSVWLMLVYWAGLRGVLVASAHAAEVEVRGSNERLPWVSLLVVVGLVGVVLGLVAVGPARAARTLGEWVPTSGGTGEYDRFARGGVNDGDEETSGANAQSTGMAKTDTFLNSPLPSLYDVTSDLYGPPCKSHEHERAIALETENARDAGKKPPDSLRPSREFPTARQGGRKPNPPKSRPARALFEVEGRTPLHVRVVAFDSFNGRTWREAPMALSAARIEKEPNSNWMCVNGATAPPIFTPAESHTFKLSAPEGALLPTPPHLARFRVGRVDRAEFFGWGHDRVLRFAERKTPSGISIETESRTADPRALAQIEFPAPLPGERFDYGALSPNLDPRVAALAHEWAAGAPRGWPQAATVVERLRSEFTHDHTHPTPGDHADPLAYFLFESKRGPDYQFATAAAVMLRTLGYSTRLVSGFYVRPEHYDPETEHTPVGKDDLHFWAEVQLPGGDWLVIEPTPSYEVLAPNRELLERLADAAGAGARWAMRHALFFGTALVALTLAWVRRRELVDAVAVRWWNWFPGRAWPEQVRQAVRVLQRRGGWAGRSRAAGQTPAAWLRRAAAGDAELARLATFAEWAAYAPDAPPPWSADEPLVVCRRVLSVWTLRRWRNQQPMEGGQPC